MKDAFTEMSMVAARDKIIHDQAREIAMLKAENIRLTQLALHDGSTLARLDVRVAQLTVALRDACSMLDDAVQLRDDAAEWFPKIAELRAKIARSP